MTEAEWNQELSSALTGTDWRIVSAGCDHPSSSCFGDVMHKTVAVNKVIRLSENTFVTRDARREEILRQIGNKTRVLRQHHPVGPDGFHVFITHHNEGAGDVFRSEEHTGSQIGHGTFEDVKTAARDWLRKIKNHECDEHCSDWEQF